LWPVEWPGTVRFLALSWDISGGATPITMHSITFSDAPDALTLQPAELIPGDVDVDESSRSVGFSSTGWLNGVEQPGWYMSKSLTLASAEFNKTIIWRQDPRPYTSTVWVAPELPDHWLVSPLSQSTKLIGIAYRFGSSENCIAEEVAHDCVKLVYDHIYPNGRVFEEAIYSQAMGYSALQLLLMHTRVLEE